MTENAKQDLLVVSVAEKYNYLAPDTSEIRLLSNGVRGNMAHCTLPVGAVSHPVAHKTVEELWYFISGKGEMWRRLGEAEGVVEVKQGTSLNIPTGASFQFRNTGEEPLCFVITTMPCWPNMEEAVPVEGKWKVG